MYELKRAAGFVAKAIFCLLLSYCLTMLIFGHIMYYLNVSAPIGLIVIPGAIAMFLFFTKLENAPKD